MEKIIWSCGKFVLNEQVCFFEQIEVDGKVKSRKLSPMFAFENWEIYALPVVNGIVYAIIGLHDGKRVFYAEDSNVNLCIKNFYSAGRDLIRKNLETREFRLLRPQNGCLVDITNVLKANVYVLGMKYVGGVLEVYWQLSRFNSEHKFFLQTADGCYQEISRDDAEQKIEKAKMLLFHPAFK